jgi:hypothetical protein
MMNREYCDSVELKTTKDKVTNYWYIVLHFLGMFTLAFIISFAIFFMFYAKSNASYNPEFQYYWVTNFQDYSRKIRLETCERTQKEILWSVKEELTLHCATLLTLKTAYESNYMKSSMCLNQLNCVWLKWIRWDWTYWFLTFKSIYQANLYYWEKFFLYHYKKSNFTLIYGFKQNDWSYKFWWSTTDMQTYVKFLDDNYNRVYKEINLLK